MAIRRLGVLDATWLLVDREHTPMHVGGLMILRLPENVPADYLRDMVARMKTSRDPVPPWDLKLYRPGIPGRFLLPAWQEDPNLDLDYHVRHLALPQPGGERELGVQVSWLHSYHMDFRRPLWECHVIEGLENNRFALFVKMHHSLIDGISGMRLLQRIMSTDPDRTDMAAPWNIRPRRMLPALDPGELSLPETLRRTLGLARRQATAVPELGAALGRLLRAARDSQGDLVPPFAAPRSLLNGRIGAQRRFATCQCSLDSLHALSERLDVSINDLVLYLCGTALRRFLLERDALPDEPLTAGIPVNIRPADDDSTGTAISFMLASLGTHLADPIQRLEHIHGSTQAAKAHLRQLPRSALNQYTILLMAPYILQLLSGLGGHTRPVFNVTISNVPGPEDPLYYNGAGLEAMYPVSLVAHGAALNITCLSYHNRLNFGFTGCRDSLPSMQRLAVFTGEALAELEARAGAATGAASATR